jgi:acyl-CoA synthetase (NDP forming)
MIHDTLFSSLFEPRSIAFIGASSGIHKWGFNILHNIMRGGYDGALYPVNPQGGSWFGHDLYKSLDDIGRPVDLAVIIVPKEKVRAAVEQCGAKGIPAAVVITAGFSETGPEGARLEREVLDAARATGMRIVGPNTMGIFTGAPRRVQAIMAATMVKPGPVAVVAQSGNLATSLMFRYTRRGLGISRLVSSGNEADLTIEDYLELLEHDDMTRLICLYVEGLRDGRRFFETASRVSRNKPIVLIKGGTSDGGAKAAASHTGAIAGDTAIFASMCRQAGVIQARSVDEVTDISGLLLSQPEITGRRVGIITQGGGWGVIATDVCAEVGLEIPPLDDALVKKLDAILPEFWSRRNPVDLVAPGRVSAITDTIDLIVKSAGMDAILLLGLGYMTLRARRWMESPIIPREVSEKPATMMITEEKKLLDMVCEQVTRYGKPIIPVMDQIAFDEPADGNLPAYLDERGLMSYSSPEQAIRALAKAAEYYRWRRNARQSG